MTETEVMQYIRGTNWARIHFCQSTVLVKSLDTLSSVYTSSAVGSYYQIFNYKKYYKFLLSVPTVIPEQSRAVWNLFLHKAMKVIDVRPPADGLNHEYTAQDQKSIYAPVLSNIFILTFHRVQALQKLMFLSLRSHTDCLLKINLIPSFLY